MRLARVRGVPLTNPAVSFGELVRSQPFRGAVA